MIRLWGLEKAQIMEGARKLVEAIQHTSWRARMILRVLRLLLTGESNQRIAQGLVVSVNTVKDHLKHLYRKLGVSNRLQASEAARHLNIL